MASSHTDLIKEIICFCQKRYNCFLWKNQTGQRGGVRFGLLGSSDILGLLGDNGRFIAIEVKIGKDTLSGDQEGFKAQIERLGGVFIEARAIEDVLVVLDGLSF